MNTSLPAFQNAVSTGSFSRTAVSCNTEHSPLLRPRTNVTLIKHSFKKLKSSTGFSGLAFLGLLTVLRMATGQNTDGKTHSASLNPQRVKICFPVIGLWRGFIGLHLGTLDTLSSVYNLHSPLQLSLAAPTLDTRSGTAVPEWIQRMKTREAACNRLCSSCINFSLSLYSPSTVMLIHSTRIHCNIGKLHFNMTETEAGFPLHIALSAHLRQRQQAEGWDRCGQLCLTYGPHVPPANV